MSIRDKIAQQHIDSCLIIDVAECVKADMAQAPKVCWQCGLSFADAILALEVEGKLPCADCPDTDRECKKCPEYRKTTIADLMEV